MGTFQDFDDRGRELLRQASHVVTYYIHSRRWRETIHADLRKFLERVGTTLTVYLPDLTNETLIRSIKEHFNDGPAIPGLIADAFAYFAGLQSEFGERRVRIGVYNTYPTYSFYKYDDTFIIAIYPTTLTPKRPPVPTFEVSGDGLVRSFVLDDIELLKEGARWIGPKDITKLRIIAQGYGPAKAAENIDDPEKAMSEGGRDFSRLYRAAGVLAIVCGAIFAFWGFAIGDLNEDRRMLLRWGLSITTGLAAGAFIGDLKFKSNVLVPGLVTAGGGYAAWLLSAWLLFPTTLPADFSAAVFLKDESGQLIEANGELVLELGNLQRWDVVRGQALLRDIPARWIGRRVKVTCKVDGYEQVEASRFVDFARDTNYDVILKKK